MRLHPRPSGRRDLPHLPLSSLGGWHDPPTAIKTARLEFQTDSDSHTLDIDLLAASFSYIDAAGKPITHSGLPVKNDLLSFMRDRGLAIDTGATQDAGIIANMLAKLAP